MRRTPRALFVMGTAAAIIATTFLVAVAEPTSPAAVTVKPMVCGGGPLRMSHTLNGPIDCGAQLGQSGVCYTAGSTTPGYRDITNQSSVAVLLFFLRSCNGQPYQWVKIDPGYRWIAPNASDQLYSFIPG